MTHPLSRRALIGTALATTAGCDGTATQTRANERPRQTAPAGAGELVTLLIGDTLDHAAPLGGEGIGPGVKRNIEKMHRLVADIEKATGMHERRREILGRSVGSDDFTCENISEHLRGIKAGPTDTVVIYYAGHGFNLGPDTDRLRRDAILRRQSAVPPEALALRPAFMPYLYCGSYGDNPNVEDAARWAAGTGARLVVVISDSCNSYIPGTGPDATPASEFRYSIAPRDARLISLFAEARGVVMMAAAKPGRYAFYHRDGGVYTRSLLRSLDALPRGRATDWTTLAEATALRLRREKVTFEGRSDWPLDPIHEIRT